MRGESVSQGLTLEVKVPHILWAPCQKDWKHEVPAQASSDNSSHHSAGGLVRLSLAFA
jgi:hypothetical protein